MRLRVQKDRDVLPRIAVENEKARGGSEVQLAEHDAATGIERRWEVRNRDLVHGHERELALFDEKADRDRLLLLRIEDSGVADEDRDAVRLGRDGGGARKDDGGQQTGERQDRHRSRCECRTSHEETGFLLDPDSRAASVRGTGSSAGVAADSGAAASWAGAAAP